MRKCILFLLILFVSSQVLNAKKKKQVRDIKVVNATYSNNDNSIRKVGNVYQFTIQTNVNNITIDSVWFGATPIPCNILSIKTKERLTTAEKKGKYMVQVNRNLYANFPQQADSTKAATLFKAPFAFRGKAVLFYKKNGIRMYEIVNQVKEVAPPRMR